MRSREFTINVPINIKIDGDNDPEISTAQDKDESELDQNPVMVPPLQQAIELQKAELGKDSPVIDKITQDTPEQGSEEEPAEVGASTDDADTELIQRLKQLISR